MMDEEEQYKYDGNLAAHAARGYELRDISRQLRESADKEALRDFHNSLTPSDRSAIAASVAEDERPEREAAEQSLALHKAQGDAKDYKLFFQMAVGAIVVIILSAIFQ